jgi:hypothetical protein
MSGSFTTYGTFVTGSILARNIASDDIAAGNIAVTSALSSMEFASEKAVITHALSTKELASENIILADIEQTDQFNTIVTNAYSIKSQDGKFSINNAPSGTILDLTNNGDLKIYGEFDGDLKESNFSNVKNLSLNSLGVQDLNVTGEFGGTMKSLNLETLHVGSLHGNIGNIDIFESDSITANSVSVTDSLSASQFAVNEAVVTDSFAAKEIVVEDFALANVSITDSSQNELPNVDVSDSYVLKVGTENNLQLIKDNSNLLEINNNVTTITGDLNITGTLGADINETNLQNLKDLTVEDITATGNLRVNGLLEANEAKIDVAAIDSLATRLLAVADALSAMNIASQNASVTNALVAVNAAVENFAISKNNNTYSLNVDESSLSIANDTQDVVNISQDTFTVNGKIDAFEIKSNLIDVKDLTVTESLDAQLTNSNLQNITNLSLDSLNVDNIVSRNVNVSESLDAQLTNSNLQNINELTLDTINVNSITGTNANFNTGLFTGDISAVNSILSGDLTAQNVNMSDLTAVNIALSGSLNSSNVNVSEHIQAYSGNIETLVTNDFAAVDASIVGGLAAIDVATRNMSVTEALASKELATESMYITNTNDAYKFDILDSDLLIQNGNVEVMRLGI